MRALTVRVTELGSGTGISRTELITAGAGGAVKRWDVLKGDVVETAGAGPSEVGPGTYCPPRHHRHASEPSLHEFDGIL